MNIPGLIRIGAAIGRAMKAAGEWLDERETKQQRKQWEKRWQRFQDRKQDFTEAELIYAATNRCECGHGLAYPQACRDPQFAWNCAGLLTGQIDESIAPAERHARDIGFAMYSVKSEDQPSANGFTTRGTIRPKPGSPWKPYESGITA